MSIIPGLFLFDMVDRYINNQDDEETKKRKALNEASLLRERALLEKVGESNRSSSGPNIGKYFNAVLKK